MTIAFALAIDALFADPHLAEDALWKAGGVGAGVPARVIRRSPDQIAEFGDSRAVLPAVSLSLRRSEIATLSAGDLVMIASESFKVIGEPISDAQGLVWACEAITV